MWLEHPLFQDHSTSVLVQSVPALPCKSSKFSPRRMTFSKFCWARTFTCRDTHPQRSMHKTKNVQLHHMGSTAFNSTVYMMWEICSLIHKPSHPSDCRMQYPALVLQVTNTEVRRPGSLLAHL